MATGGRTPITVVIADDHTLFREGVTELLATVPGVQVVGGASSGEEACDQVDSLQPDVLVLDVQMPGQDVRETLRRLRANAPQTRTVVLTMHENLALARELLALGAAAYLIKGATRHELVAAVHSVVSNRTTGHVLLSVPTRGQAGDDLPEDLLSPREYEVLQLAAEACSNPQIARRLSISEGTVKRHLRNIYAKLGALSRLDAVNKAIAGSLLPSPGELTRHRHDPQSREDPGR